MSPTDIERNETEKSSDRDPYRIKTSSSASCTQAMFDAKHTAKSSPNARTLETIPTRTDSETSFEHGQDHPRQVIAVSVSKGPSAFFNLARKFLVTDEQCDLSALEGAIVSAVDAAHLLERSKIATITRVQTSYVTVDPKKKKDHYSAPTVDESSEHFRLGNFHSITTSTSRGTSQALETLAAAAEIGRENIENSLAATDQTSSQSQSRHKSSPGTLRRARIVITVQRTDAYKKWLEENPVQDVISGEEDDRT
eukprot:CCRYP_010280-RA/>CCRYP_010280-RA protein AED:0.03 eAED:0.03 QI:642/1/1/1/1/1/2/114/252